MRIAIAILLLCGLAPAVGAADDAADIRVLLVDSKVFASHV